MNWICLIERQQEFEDLKQLDHDLKTDFSRPNLGHRVTDSDSSAEWQSGFNLDLLPHSLLRNEQQVGEIPKLS